MDTEIRIRVANTNDAQALLDIYGYYVENTAITYEYDVPSLEDFKGRIKHIVENNYPYLVAESDGKIIGYAYADKFQSRPGYAWNAEMTIYLDNSVRSKGLGRKLYTLLEEVLKAQGVVKLIALITPPDNEEDLKTYPSMRFHEKLGYKPVAKLDNCGYKFNRWYNTIFMDKTINEPHKDMPNIKPFNEVRDKFGL